MAKGKTISREDAINELVSDHGLNFLQANNLIHGQKNVSEADLKEIKKRIADVSKTPIKEFKRGKVRFRRIPGIERGKRPLYSATKNYVKSLHLGDQ